MLHRALFGSFERFIGLLLEHYAGALPLWLSPIQARIVSVSESHAAAALKLADELRQEGLRVETDLANESVGNKIRKASSEKLPYILVVGDKEANSETLSVRDRGAEKIREISRQDFFQEIKEKLNNRS
mgnify:FL=1